MDRLEDCKIYYQKNKKLMKEEGYASEIEWAISEIERLRKGLEKIAQRGRYHVSPYGFGYVVIARQALEEE